MVELVCHLAHDALEGAEVHHHVTLGAVRPTGPVIAETARGVLALQLLGFDGGHDAPTVAVEVLAFAVVVGEEVGRVKVCFCLESVHASPFLRPARDWRHARP